MDPGRDSPPRGHVQADGAGGAGDGAGPGQRTVFAVLGDEIPGNLPPVAGGWHVGTSTLTMVRCIRRWSVLFVVLLAVGFGLAAGGVRAAEDEFGVNLLRNGSFEQGMSRPDGWEWSNADWALRDARFAFDGGVSGLLYAAEEEKEMAWLQRNVPLLAGARYVVSGRIRAEDPAVAVVGVRWEGDGRSQEQQLHRGITPDGQWHRVELEFVATETGPVTVV